MTGDAPTTSERSAILLPTKMPLYYIILHPGCGLSSIYHFLHFGIYAVCWSMLTKPLLTAEELLYSWPSSSSSEDGLTRAWDVLGWDLAKSRRREIGVYSFLIVLTFDRRLVSAATELSNKLQSDRNMLRQNLAVSWHCEIVRRQDISTHDPM